MVYAQQLIKNASPKNASHKSTSPKNGNPKNASASGRRFGLPIEKALSCEKNVHHSIREYPESIQRLIGSLRAVSLTTPEQIGALIAAANVSAYDLIPWADFSHSLLDSYGRKMVYYGGHFEIMAMSWVPGDFSAIHDHGHTQWGAVQCFGEADHFTYTFERGEFGQGVLKRPMPAHYQRGDIRVVDHDTVHQMGNGGTKPFLSLHVYGCAQPEASITANARVFDLLEESVQFTDGGVFFCLPEHKIERREYGLQGDADTVAMQHVLMRNRIQRMLEVSSDYLLEKKLAMLERRLR